VPELTEVEVGEFTLDGDAVARGANRRAVRVRGVLPGERVVIRLQEGRAETTAELVEVRRRSPHRVTPACRHFGPCGGCSWQHVAYGEQLRTKERLLAGLLRASMGTSAPTVAPMIAADDQAQAAAATPRAPTGTGADDTRLDPAAPWGFRHKVHFVFAPAATGVAVGHYAAGSRRIVSVQECPVHAPAGNAAAFALRDALTRARVPAADDRLDGVARHVVARVGHRSGEVMLTLVATTNDKRLRAAGRYLLASGVRLDSYHLNIHDRPGPYLFGRATRTLQGRERMREDVAGVSFLVSPTAFFQTNLAAAEHLVAQVLAQVPFALGLPVLDLYAGAGLFALPLARRGHRVLAVEENAEAVADGEASREFSRIDRSRCRFLAGRVETSLERLARPGEQDQDPFDSVIIDPPRQGCPEVVRQALFESLRPARVVYVSCNPEALARDMAAADRLGYRALSVQPVDMFPHTPHIEAVACLTRRG
jgi:23S rRNA (uracil1939-C5)-methyltransferase